MRQRINEERRRRKRRALERKLQTFQIIAETTLAGLILLACLLMDSLPI